MKSFMALTAEVSHRGWLRELGGALGKELDFGLAEEQWEGVKRKWAVFMLELLEFSFSAGWVFLVPVGPTWGIVPNVQPRPAVSGHCPQCPTPSRAGAVGDSQVLSVLPWGVPTQGELPVGTKGRGAGEKLLPVRGLSPRGLCPTRAVPKGSVPHSPCPCAVCAPQGLSPALGCPARLEVWVSLL